MRTRPCTCTPCIARSAVRGRTTEPLGIDSVWDGVVGAWCYLHALPAFG
eukprot:COSAG02_NODE_52218_length_309_cov_0.738095_1_plen_48_part_10